MISEFRDWLSTRTNRARRPFQAGTISAYADAAVALDAWMSREGIEEEFTACDTAMLNRFFAAYHGAHGQGGTNTKQRNLRHLFTWLEREHDHPHPYTDELQRYSPAKSRPSTLAGSFITDLLEVTGGGRSRRFVDARDHAIIRVLTEGVRRTELVQLQTTDLPVDVIAQPFVRVVPLKGARAATEGRIVALAPATARALVASPGQYRSAGWAGIGQMTGFGEIHPLPGIWDSLRLDTAVTLPIGVEAYAAFALRVWLTSSSVVSEQTRGFARGSAIAALVLGKVLWRGVWRLARDPLLWVRR